MITKNKNARSDLTIELNFEYRIRNIYTDITVPPGGYNLKTINPGFNTTTLNMDDSKDIFNNLWVGTGQKLFYESITHVYDHSDSTFKEQTFTGGTTKICQLKYNKTRTVLPEKSIHNGKWMIYTGSLKIKLNRSQEKNLFFQFYNNPINDKDWMSREYFVDAIDKVNRVRNLEFLPNSNSLKSTYKIIRIKDYLYNTNKIFELGEFQDHSAPQYKNISFNLNAKTYLKPVKGDQYYLACQGAIIPRDKRLKVGDIEYNLCKLDYGGDTDSGYGGSYNVTLVFPVSNQVTNGYKYSYLKNPKNGKNWITKERLIMESDESNPWKDRILERNDDDDDTSRINDFFGYFNFPGTYDELFDVTFKLTPEDGGSSSDSYFLAGGFVGNANAIKMTKNGDIYETTIKLPKGFTGNYTYTKNPLNWNNWIRKENLNEQFCADSKNFNDRTLPEVTKSTNVIENFGNCRYTGPITIKITNVKLADPNNSVTRKNDINIPINYNSSNQFLNEDPPKYIKSKKDWPDTLKSEYNNRLNSDNYVVEFTSDKNPTADKSSIVVTAKKATGSEVSTKFQDNANSITNIRKVEGKDEWKFSYVINIGETKNPDYRQSTIKFPDNYKILDKDQNNIGNYCSILLKKYKKSDGSLFGKIIGVRGVTLGNISRYSNVLASIFGEAGSTDPNIFPEMIYKNNIYLNKIKGLSSNQTIRLATNLQKGEYRIRLICDEMNNDDFDFIKNNIKLTRQGNSNDVLKTSGNSNQFTRYSYINNGTYKNKYLLEIWVKANSSDPKKTTNRKIKITFPEKYNIVDSDGNDNDNIITIVLRGRMSSN